MRHCYREIAEQLSTTSAVNLTTTTVAHLLRTLGLEELEIEDGESITLP